MRCIAALAAGVTLALSPIATAQDYSPSDTTKRALAAGYKALFTCSGYFNAGQSLSEIESNALSGIYVDYRPIMEEIGDAEIVERERTVIVEFDGYLNPRAAVWRPGIGCSLLPIGTPPTATDWLPSLLNMPSMSAPDNTTALGDNVTLTENTFALDLLGIPVSFAFDGSTYGEGTRTSAVIVLH